VSRIRKAYEGRFRTLLQEAGARRPQAGVEWLLAKAGKLSGREGISLADALTRTYEELASRPYFRNINSPVAQSPFLCDAGLGGLARWLRGAGFEALWRADIDDDELLREAREKSGTILTTDSILMERRVLRDRIIPALWLPPTLSIGEQLSLVFREFGLSVREPRCMACGGELRREEKETLHDRIPPKTYRWLDEFFVCNRCGKLFWHGTHWERIKNQLQKCTASRIYGS
jgi:uncharacterized protein with PIN domain